MVGRARNLGYSGRCPGVTDVLLLIRTCCPCIAQGETPMSADMSPFDQPFRSTPGCPAEGAPPPAPFPLPTHDQGYAPCRLYSSQALPKVSVEPSRSNCRVAATG